MSEIFQDISLGEISILKECWEELNKIHETDSVYFKEYYHKFTFDERIQSFLNINEKNIKITIIKNDQSILGYCISTMSNNIGEIDSLYLNPEIRSKHFGQRLVELHTKWLKSNGCKKIVVTVSYGHDSVLKFYNKLGFYERLIELEIKEEKEF